MSRILQFACLFMLSACISAQPVTKQVDKFSYTPPIPWNPKTYVCQQPIDKIIIDGLDQEQSWQSLDWSDDFVDIEGGLKPRPSLKTSMKMLWDEDYFYFFARMEEPHIWAKLTERDAVIYQDDAFEIFIDPEGDAHNYYEIQVNALSTIWDLFMMWPYRQKVNPNHLSDWNVDNLQHAVHINGTINDSSDTDQYWTVEMAIPWSALKKMGPDAKPPKVNDQWRFNFSRVDWDMSFESGDYEKILNQEGEPLSEKYSVWSAQSAVAMHMPEWWGYVQFAEESVVKEAPAFITKPDEQIKWALWQLYYQQNAQYKSSGTYRNDMESFTLPVVEVCTFQPNFLVGDSGFQISSPSCDGRCVWIINEMGKITSKGID